jgi:hypothetical protein
VGEPPLLLPFSVFFAIRDAVSAAGEHRMNRHCRRRPRQKPSCAWKPCKGTLASFSSGVVALRGGSHLSHGCLPRAAVLRRSFGGAGPGAFLALRLHAKQHGDYAMNWTERIFKLREHNTNVRTELVAGLTTFLSMAYIMFVNPSILGDAGMPKGSVFVATCLIAALGSTIMALYANYPIALAPGMGLNAYFAYVVVLKMAIRGRRPGGGVRLGMSVPDLHDAGPA